MEFQIRIARNRTQYYWVLVARNGETLSTSEMYNTKQSARKGIRATRLCVIAPVYDISL